jgi:hypothetical protein
MFSITYLKAFYVSSVSARLMTSSSQAAVLSAYFTTPSYNSVSGVLSVNNIQIVGGHGCVYFVLVLYKQIAVDNVLKTTTVNIRMNQPPTV